MNHIFSCDGHYKVTLRWSIFSLDWTENICLELSSNWDELCFCLIWLVPNIMLPIH